MKRTLGKYLFIVLFLVFSKGHKFDFNINQKNIFPCIITRVYVFFFFSISGDLARIPHGIKPRLAFCTETHCELSVRVVLWQVVKEQS